MNYISIIMDEKLKETIDESGKEGTQQAFLLKLSDALRPLSAPQQIKIKAMQVLGEHLNASRCYYAEVLEDGKHCVIDNSFHSGLGTIDGTYWLEDFGKAKVAALQRGEVILAADVANDTSVTQEERDRNLEMQIHAYINVPLIKENKLICLLGVNQSVVRHWTAIDLANVHETAERTWAAIEKAKAEEALRKSEEKYRSLFNSIDQGFTLCELIRNKEGKGIDFYMLEVNATYEEQTGVSKERVLGKKILEVFPSINKWIETYAAVVDHQRPVEFEHYFGDTDRWFAIKAYPVEKERFAVLFSNITARKQAEEKLKESENRFHAMADASPVLIWTIDANGLPNYFNKTFLDFVGATRDEDISDWEKIVHPDDVQSTLHTINTKIAQRRSYLLECRLLRADGQWRWVLAQGNPNMGANDEFLGFVGSSVDITERKQAEQRIKESEERLRLATQTSGVGIWEWNVKTNEIRWDAQMFHIYGVKPTPDGVVEFSTWWNAVFPDDREEQDRILQGTVKHAGTSKRSFKIFRADNGLLCEIEAIETARTNALGETEWIVGTNLDITDLKRSEEKIKKSEHRFHELIYSSPSMMAILKGEDMIIEIANDAVLASWGKGKDIIGKSLFSVLPETVEQGFDKLLLNVYQTGEPFHAYETPVRLPRNGINEFIYYNFVYQAQRNINGEIEGVAILANEVTSQALLNKKIKVSEEKFKLLVLQAPVAICVLRGEDYVIETMNEGMSEFWDRTLAQALNKPVFDVLPEVKDQGIKEILDNVYSTGERCVVQELSINIKRNNKLENAFVKFVYEPLREADGTVSGVMALAHEITEQVAARKKVEASEKKFEAAIIAVEGIIWTNNANGEMIGEQPGWANLTGQHFEEYQSYGWTKAIHPDDAQPTVDAWNRAVATNSTFEFEHRVKTAQNEWRLFSVKAVPAFDDNGAIQQWVGVHTDITEQKVAQEKLAYRTALLEAHNETSIDGILLVDTHGKILSFNQRFVEIWNMPQQIVNDKDDEAALLFAMSQLVNPQQFIEKVKYLYEHPTETSLDELELKNGKIVERNGYSVIGEDGTYYAWSWTFKDITQRKRIELDLKNTKDQLELTFKNIPAGVYLLNEKGEMIYVNDRGAAVYGDFKPEDLLAAKDLPALLKIADDLFERYDENGHHFNPQNSPAYISLTTGLPSQAILMQTNKVTKETRWHYVQGAPLFNEDGKVSMVLVTSTDITVQKSAEQKMRESEVRFRLLSDEMPQFVWTGDAGGHLTYFNEAVYKYSGLTKEDLANDAWIQIVHPDDREENTRLWIQSIATGNDFIFEHRFKRADGEYRWQLSRAVPQRDEQGVIQQWIGTSTDIHDKKNIEEQLEKLVAERTKELQRSNEDLQQFAHVASHDLKEPIRKIETFTSRLEQHLHGTLDETSSRFIERIHVATNRMFNMIDGVLTYSTTNALTQIPQIVDLDEVVKSIETDLEVALQKTNGTLHYYDLPTLEGAPVLLYQLFYNLIYNSLKFARAGVPPRITISSEAFVEEDKSFVRITLQDNGIGFEPEHAALIFETFTRLNSKDKYEGTGLGLSLCKKIVERHAGSIVASGTPGEGATFTITLPVKQKQTSI